MSRAKHFIAIFLFFICLSATIRAEVKSTNDLIVFYHIRKCGGTTVFTTLEKKFANSQVHASGDLSRVDCDQLKFLRAHLQFHETSPLFPNAKNITLLREPVSRVVSSYNYWLENYKSWSKEKQERTFPLNESNESVKILSDYAPDDPSVTIEEHLESAKRNLEKRFYFVGIMERMDESMGVLCRLLGWKEESRIPVLNTTITHPKISRKVLRKIKKQNWADSELYAFAEKLFEQKSQEVKNLAVASQDRAPRQNIHYSFEEPFEGEGWGFREGKGFRRTIGTWVPDALYDRVFRTSHQSAAWVAFPLDSTLSYRLKFTCASPSSKNLESLEVEIDGHPLKLQRETFGVWSTYTAEIEKGMVKNIPTRLTFKVPVLYRPSDHEDTPDNRDLGISLSKIHLMATTPEVR